MLSVVMLNVVMLNVVMLNIRYAECLYAECRSAECSATVDFRPHIIDTFFAVFSLTVARFEPLNRGSRGDCSTT